MDTNKIRDISREQFEAYRDKRNAELEAEGHKPGSRWHISNAHYPAWQASREAVVVELPELRSVHDRDCWSRTNGLGFNNALKEARQVIEAQGLKVEVKP